MNREDLPPTVPPGEVPPDAPRGLMARFRNYFLTGLIVAGPIALIDEHMPVVVIAPYDRVFEKTVSNMQEVAARGGNIILMTDAKGAAEATIQSLVTIVLPDMAATFTPMVYAVPVQLLAYHTAVVMGTDVDQPRNLAKSVTVE